MSVRKRRQVDPVEHNKNQASDPVCSRREFLLTATIVLPVRSRLERGSYYVQLWTQAYTIRTFCITAPTCSKVTRWY